MKIFAVLTALSLAASTSAGIVAGPITNSANGHLYYLLTANTWTGSEAEAVLLGGHLVTINDAAENQWVVDAFANYDNVIRPLWIGLTDRDSEGTFTWVSGEPFTYSNWNTNTGEPNNANGSYEEDFAYIIQDDNGNPDVFATFWNDVPDNGAGVIPPMHGVVEINPAVVRDGQLCWLTRAGVEYQAQWKPNTSRGAWVNFGSRVVGTGGEVCVSDEPIAGGNRIYRVSVLAQ